MQLVSWLVDVAAYIPPFLFVLGIIIFVHELGHFLVARWCGVAVDTFSLGFGPELFGWNDRAGTRWRVAAVPLGGYVKFAGDDNAASVPDPNALAAMDAYERSRSFYLKPLWQRAAIVAAGPAANFLLAIAIFAIAFLIVGRPAVDARVTGVEPASPAAEAGFAPGDVITAIDGEEVGAFIDVLRTVSSSGGRTLTFTVTRDGAPVELVATPEQRDLTDRFGTPYSAGFLGISNRTEPEDVRRETFGPVGAVAAGVEETVYITTRTVEVIAGVITGEQSAKQFGGPLRVAKISGDMASIGVTALFTLAAMLSISIGLINLMPIPMLDGGHLLFYAVEAVRGRPLSPRAQDVGFRIGLGLVLLLMMFATFNDVLFLTS
ncbi:RIP metalloprotease RseP [Acuticoccus sp.]|uniref:RIP metalloprotease RseP n=1 Tax=Acuticoccus sp. TaxID=1904378 RepID=UPI003B5254EA